MTMNRPSIPKKLQLAVLYESAYRCAVCQVSGCQIHHIDENNANNVESNLIALCPNHHGEAHTKRDHGKNLDINALQYAKKKWTDLVKAHRECQATVAGQINRIGATSFLAAGIAWGYINHRRVSEMADIRSLAGPSQQAFEYCKAKGLVDSSGVPFRPATWKARDVINQNTIYDWFDFGDDQRFHRFYTGLVDQIAIGGSPIHFDSESWTLEGVENLLQSGSLVLLRAYFGFKTQSATSENEHRRVTFSKNGASIEFYVDTRNMMGDTSIYNSFFGRKTATALVLVKDVASVSGKAHVSATPLALGVGFEFRPVKALGAIDDRVAT